jgi:Domain of unknown function (DUF3854)
MNHTSEYNGQGDPLSWRNVTRSNPCPACKRADWCSVSSDGSLCCCRREAQGATSEKQDASGGAYYIHRLTPQPPRADSWPEPIYSLASGKGVRAEADLLYQVYRPLLEHLTLSSTHTKALTDRGLEAKELRRLGYSTLGRGRGAAVQKLIKLGLEKHFPNVPGFFVQERNNGRFWSLAGASGLLVPVRDAEKRIVALSIRPDNAPGGAKYIWLTGASKDRGGPGPGSPVHVPLFDGDKSIIRISEGALKADVATKLSGVLTIGLPGVGAWRKAAPLLKTLGATTARVAYDADCRTNRAVAGHLARLVADLRSEQFTVALEVWSAADGKGVDDLMRGGKSPTVLTGEKEIDAALSEIVKAAGAAAGGDRVPILITTDECTVNDAAVEAIQKSPAIFCRGNMLVTVLRPPPDKGRVVRPVGSPVIVPTPPCRLREELTRVISFTKPKRSPQGVFEVPAHPPEWCVSAVHARGSWPGVRRLEAVVETPMLRPDGTILDRPGYDEATGLLYEPQIDFLPIAANPSREDGVRAGDRLLELVNDFDFAEPKHTAAFLAAMLTPFARFAIDGHCPLFLAEASTPGSGKSLLCDVIAVAATGRTMARTPFPDKDEELRKTITSIVIGGDRMTMFDNVTGAFGGPALDMALTGGAWKDRVLGRSEMTADLPVTTLFFATGNNVTLRGDIRRRVLPWRLEPKVENPETRSDFTHPNLLKYVADNRASIVADCLTVLRAYEAAGRPNQTLPPWGSFESWSDLVRGAIKWLSLPDVCETRKGLAAADSSTGDLAAVIAGWRELPSGTMGITAADAIKAVRENEGRYDAEKKVLVASKYDTLREVFHGWARSGSDLPSAKTVGRRLMAYRGRVIHGEKLHEKQNRDHTAEWAVVPAGK